MSNTEPHAQVVAFVRSGEALVTSNADVEEGEKFFRVLINAGTDDDVAMGERVLVYAYGPEVIDPQSGESLGNFEVVRGEGKIVQTQPKMSVVRAEVKETITRRKAQNALLALGQVSEPTYETVTRAAPFDGVQIGDNVRFI